MHDEDEQNFYQYDIQSLSFTYVYQRGYEWWLMTEAKKRNPDIVLYGLPWGFPGWIGEGNDNFPLNANQAMYQTSWVEGARDFWNLK
jgi:galactosylceramidase